MTLLADGTAVLFGGWSFGFTDHLEERIFNDTYSLKVSSSGAAWRELSSSGDAPTGRYGHSLTVLADGTAVLFGGRGTGWSLHNDISTLEVSSSGATWTELSSSGDVRAGLTGHTLTVLADGTAVLFGGYGEDI